jgi:predicted O-linked N-acetylglucosamine transferase (SPINDLY family)
MKLEELNIQQLNGYLENAIIKKNINGQLNALNLLIRYRPTAMLYIQIADIYSHLQRSAIEAIYLKAALDKGIDNTEKINERLRKCTEKFLSNNEKVRELIPYLAKKPYDKEILIQRKKFHEYAKKNELDKVYLIGKKQHEKKKIDPEIQGIWCSIAYRKGEHQLALTSAFIGFINNQADWIWITNVADILIQLRKATQALDYAIAAVNLRPKSGVGWLNLGAVWDLQGKTWESLKSTKKAIELNPENSGAWTNLGNAYKNSGELIKALPAYREALKIDPSNSALWSNLLFGINYDPTVSAKQISEETFKFGEYTERKYNKINLKHLNRISEKINIGFISPDIRSHPVAYFVEPLWRNINKEKYKIFFYDNFPTEDQITRRFKGLVDSYQNISGLTDEKAIEIIVKDEIIILIDLSGHTARNRLQIFARKPAPIQITWLGHPNTTGLTRIDWRITDIYTDPIGNENKYTEKLCRIPTTMCYAPLIKYPDKINEAIYQVNETPALKNKYITFGTCSNLGKISPSVISTWASIVKRVKSSKLLIESPGLDQKEFIEALYSKFEKEEINRDRLILVNRISSMQYLRYHEIDIALDPFPYGGGTTTCDLLWMGVPMITLIGERPMSRVGYGILKIVGKTEWTTETIDQYIDKAIYLAKDISKLNMIRKSLRDQFSKSLMMNGRKYADSFDKAFVEMLKIYHTKDDDKSIRSIEIMDEQDEINMVEEEINNNSLITLNDKSYINLLKEGDNLIAKGNWKEAYTLFNELRDRYGAEPNALFGAGLSCSKLNDFERATRFMADALLRRQEPKWIPWLASAYEKRNFILPFYILSSWLINNHKEDKSSQDLYKRARILMANELEKRGLFYPNDIQNYDVKMAANLNLEIVELLKNNQNQKALELVEESLQKFPISQPLLINASLAAKRLQQYEKAAKWSLLAFAINPLGTGAITNFGNLLVAANSPHDSMLLLEAGAIINREDPMLWGNLAVAYNSIRVAPWEAEFAARHALKFNQNVATNWSALAKALSRQGRMSEALVAMERANEIEPERRGTDLFTLQYAEEISPEKIAEAHLIAGKNIENSIKTNNFIYNNDLTINKKLKIGFVSGDFVKHPVSYFMVSTFKNINRNKFELYIYFTRQLKDEDNISNIIKNNCDKWSNVFEFNDDQLYNYIKKDEIDILIDLAGHTAHNRLSVFARKPAPVQVTWLGHPNTTGLKSIDWKFTYLDSILSGHEKYYTEKIWRMETAGYAYTPLISNPSLINEIQYAVNQTPALKNGYVTFGCCNNLAKVSNSVFQLWASILRKNNNYKILLEAPGLHQREFKRSLVSRFEKFGVVSEQLILLNRDTNKQYLIYNEIDIALDPFPYNGGTTTCDLLWMGVPLVTMTGQTEVSRLGTSMLNLINQKDWIAANPDEYLKISTELASDINKLNEIRLGLRRKVQNSPLMNQKLAIQDLEDAFINIWKIYVDKQSLTNLN